jgi:hypothetical protein
MPRQIAVVVLRIRQMVAKQVAEAAMMLSGPQRARGIVAIVDRLQRWPEVSGAKPLRKELVGHYRIRTGD